MKNFTVSFRIAKRKSFTVYYRLNDNQSYFSTTAELLNYKRSDYSQCGQAQNDILYRGSLAYDFFKKWDIKHLETLTALEFEELEKDINVLKNKYPYIKNDNFDNMVELDREVSKKERD